MQELCDRCMGEITFERTPNLTHYGKYVCEKCGKWFKWVENPKKTKRTKTSKINIKNVAKFHKKEKPFCFICLRTKEQLGESETLTIDHIEELNQGGKDEIENLQILCTACHKLKNWARLYLNWHYKK